MKQYRRSRPEASRSGVRRAKALLEGEKESGTGRRILNSYGGIPPHPLLKRIEVEKLTATVGSSSGGDEEMAKKKMSDLQKRQDFLRAMANFRPKETVFEAFATGGQRDLIYSSQVDKCANGSAAALVAMKSMRRQMKIARDKGESLVIAGSKSAQTLNGDADEADLGDVEEGLQYREKVEDYDVNIEQVDSAPEMAVAEGKRRLSKAERKKMKKDPNYKPSSNSDAPAKKSKAKRGDDFRDDLHFIENDGTRDTAAATRSRQIEAAMQPSASSSSKGSAFLAYRIEENMLDIVGDENVDLVKKQRMMRWDKSKRKYVQTTVGDELSGESKSKRTRLESGQLVKSDKLKLGELYEKWQKKTNRSIGRVGVFDDVIDDTGAEAAAAPLRKGQKGSSGKQSGGSADDERKTAVSIRKEREKKDHNRMKNMKRDDRRKLERKQRSEHGAAHGGPGGNGNKKGPSGRWKGSKKGGKR